MVSGRAKCPVYLGIGSNLGDRYGNLEKAVSALEDKDGINVMARSGYYETMPVGGPPQGKYINGALKINTVYGPPELLGILKLIEGEMGRTPSGKDHPRIIDIDILMYGDLVMDTPALVVPHPRMHERGFVLKGLVEIAPEAVHPVTGRTVKELYDILVQRQGERSDP